MADKCTNIFTMHRGSVSVPFMGGGGYTRRAFFLEIVHLTEVSRLGKYPYGSSGLYEMKTTAGQ